MSENNLIQRWIIWSTDRQRFFRGKSGTELFSWTTTPDLSRFRLCAKSVIVYVKRNGNQ